jgi:hypothetical protein
MSKIYGISSGRHATKKIETDGHQWFIPVILATQEAESRKIEV